MEVSRCPECDAIRGSGHHLDPSTHNEVFEVLVRGLERTMCREEDRGDPRCDC